MPALEFIGHSFPAEIYFAPNERSWHALLRRVGIPRTPYPDTDAQLNHFYGPAGNVFVITAAEKADNYSATQVIGLLAHELMHVVQYLEQIVYGNNIGEGDKRFDQETEAYLMQGLVMWIVESWALSGRKFKGDK